MRRVVCALLCAGAACSDNPVPRQDVAFNRPGDVAVVCFDVTVASDGTTADIPVPLSCCPAASASSAVVETDVDAGVSQDAGQGLDGGGGMDTPDTDTSDTDTPNPCGFAATHALVTQTTRGEIATVEFGEQRPLPVLDSDRSIPGFTFVDAGELPRALVVPPHLPGDETKGPKWVYVASRQRFGTASDDASANEGGVPTSGNLWTIRSIAACRFRTGTSCGPELDIPGGRSVPLPGEPADMVLVNGDTLVVSIPDRGEVVAVALQTDASSAEPFATATPGSVAALPVAADVELPAPEAEVEPYEFICGGDFRERLASPYLQLPAHQRADAGTASRPQRIVVDEDSGSILVADAGQPVLHVLALAPGGTLSVTATVPTGAPLRAFAVTPLVASSLEQRFVEPSTPDPPADGDEADGADDDEDGAEPEPAEDGDILPAGTRGAETLRYLYAIDDSDGSVMAFAFDAAAPSLTPLLIPSSLTWADRIDLRVAGSTRPIARDLAVIVTPSAALPEGTSCTDLADPPATSVLRGVSLAVLSDFGDVHIVDVDDHDAPCRGALACEDPTTLRADRSAFAMRRHAPRLASFALPTVAVAEPNQFACIEANECPEGYTLPELPENEKGRVCVAADPWVFAGGQGGLEYQPVFARFLVGARSPEEGTIAAPQGVDFCVLGGLQGDELVATNATGAQCLDLEEGAETIRLPIESLQGSQLVLGPDAAPVLECAAGEVTAALSTPHYRVRDRLQERPVSPDPIGQCELDPGFDPAFNRRADLSTLEEFDEEALADSETGPCPVSAVVDVRTMRDFFRPVGSQFNGEARNLYTVTGSPTRFRFSISLNSGDIGVKPNRIRFNPVLRELYTVDSAAQGLGRWQIRSTGVERDLTAAYR